MAEYDVWFRVERLNSATGGYEFVGDVTTEVEADAMADEFREALDGEYRVRKMKGLAACGRCPIECTCIYCIPGA